MVELKQEELHEWLLHPVTRALRDQYKADIERLRGAWMGGAFATDAALDAKVRGQCEVMSQFLDLEIEDFN